MSQAKPISVFLCGDVMTGRGIDQVLPCPGNPVLHEPYVGDAREYVKLAETAHGPIPRPVDFAYVWGDALVELHRAETDVRIVNLETSITSSDDYWPKEVLYRMHPRNIGCLAAAGIDCCCLANNHVLDWGRAGLVETLDTLDAAGVARAGAGLNAAEAAAPAVLTLVRTVTLEGREECGRVLVFSLGSTTSGIPPDWAATNDRPGVHLLRDLSAATSQSVANHMRQFKRPFDVAVASIHWGSNWGYGIPSEQIDFAHRLVEQGIDVVHGHSSHHAKGIEVYREHLILYGCGDFVTDYEGISGHERHRADLAVMYLARIDPRHGQLVSLRLVPFQSQRFRLLRATAADASWLCDLLNRLGAPLGTQARLEGDNSTTLRWR